MKLDILAIGVHPDDIAMGDRTISEGVDALRWHRSEGTASAATNQLLTKGTASAVTNQLLTKETASAVTNQLLTNRNASAVTNQLLTKRTASAVTNQSSKGNTEIARKIYVHLNNSL